ncbi:hypothetical protein [Streptomyces olivaceoviridis]
MVPGTPRPHVRIAHRTIHRGDATGAVAALVRAAHLSPRPAYLCAGVTGEPAADGAGPRG